MSVDPVSLAVTAALTAGSMALQMSRKIEGARLDSLDVTVADYGTPLNYFYGTRRFQGCPIFWAEPLKEVKRKRKTKGGKYNEYTYYGTFAAAIAGHEIDGVTRVWFDKHLAYDATGPGPMSVGELFAEVISGNKGKSGSTRRGQFAQYCRFYLGTETQEPDPRMLATVEADFGTGSCPAYRGTSFLMLEDVPLEKVGNRIPQIMVEATSGAVDSYPWETYDVATLQPDRLWGFTFSPDYSRMVWGSASFEMWDVAARTLISSGTWNVDGQVTLGVSNSGSIYAVDGGQLRIFGPDGIGSIGSLSIPQGGDGCIVKGAGDGREVLCVLSGLFNYYFYMMTLGSVSGLLEINLEEATGIRWSVTSFVADSYGDIWAVGCTQQAFVTTDTAYFYRIINTGARPDVADFHAVSGLPARLIPTVAAAHIEGQFVISWDNDYLYGIDDETFSVIASRTYSSDVYNTAKQFLNLPPGASTIWLNNVEISLSDLTTVRTANLGSWKVEDASGIIYDPVNHALICAPQFTEVITWRYLDRINGGQVTLQHIAEDVAARCGIISGSHSFGALDQSIKGYSWAQGSGRDILEPLFDAFYSDIRPHDFVIEGVKRGAASAGTIDVTEFVRDGDTRYSVSIKQDSDLPRALTMSFADINADQQPNSVVVQRPLDAVDSVRELSIDMTTLAESADTARQLADRYFRSKWIGRTRVDTRVTMQRIGLEPADVWTLGLDGVSINSSLRRMIIGADGMIKTEWERDESSAAALSGADGAEMDGRVEQVIPVPGLTKGVVLDVPLAVDAHDSTTPFLYYGAAPYREDVFWAGADFQQADNDVAEEYDPAWAAVAARDAMDWGYATNALDEALTTVLDYGSTLTIVMKCGTLASSTEAAVLGNGAINLLLVGADERWEYVQFVTATLVDTDTYEVSGLLRGCRGTEHHVATHEEGDMVVVMGGGFQRRGVGAGEIGDTDYYKAVSQGRSASSAFSQALTFTAAANRPYSPVHGSLEKDGGSGDWTIAAVRRTRLGGANIDGQDVPLGESAESWSADIMDGATVVRTITGSSLPLIYTDAQAVADFGSNPSSLDVNLYQVSPALSLRGYPLALAA